MKRKLNMGLALVILLCSFAVPVSATEVSDEETFFDVLSFTSPNASNNLIVNADANGLVSARFELPLYGEIQYVDAVISIYGAITTELTAELGGSEGWQDLTVEQINGEFYRIYGSIYFASKRFYLRFQADDLVSVTFKSVKISYNALEYFPINAYCVISSTYFSGTINYVPTDTVNHRNFLAGNEYLELGYTLFIYTDEWTKYDYIDITLMLNVQSVISVSCAMGSQIVPMDISYLSNDVSAGEYIVTFRVDCTELDRSTGDYPQIIVSGQLIPDAYNLVSVLNVAGLLAPGNGSILGHYFRDLKTFFEAWYIKMFKTMEGDTTSGDTFKDDSSTLIGGLGDISASMDAVQRPTMDGIDIGFSVDITDATTLMSGLFGEVTAVGWLSKILLASVVVALLAYILYGKG